MRAIEAGLTADLGGDLSTQQKLLVQAVAVKGTRLALLGEVLLAGNEPSDGPITMRSHGQIRCGSTCRRSASSAGVRRHADLDQYIAAKGKDGAK